MATRNTLGSILILKLELNKTLPARCLDVVAVNGGVTLGETSPLANY